MTHRQLIAWQQWLRDEYNHPSRTDYYLMQLTSCVLRTDAKLEDLRIKFKGSVQEAPVTKEQAIAQAKRMVASIFGFSKEALDAKRV
jgi:hypothetical protein